MTLGSQAKRLIKSAVHIALPTLAPQIDQYLWRVKQATRLSHSCPAGCSVEHAADAALASSEFRPTQKRSEIIELMRRLRDLRAKNVCEIGGFQGGTLFLFSRCVTDDGRLISIDCAYQRSQVHACRRFAVRNQTVTCLRADSHSAETVHRVGRWLAGTRIDFLFIDGDHSSSGVEADFRLFAPAVRRGGLIAFHDIHPDFRMKHGTPTGNDVGDVPTFWAQLRGKYETEEFIEDHEQDGFGIGLLHWE